MKYTRQDLEQMTIKQLRLIDVREVEEEHLIQEVLNEKLLARTPNVAINRSDAPDIKTPEEEAAYQKVIDEREARVKARLAGSTNAANAQNSTSDAQSPEDDVSNTPELEKASDVKLVDHEIIQEDLDNNPELVSEGIKVGDVVQIPAEDDSKVADEGKPKEDDPDAEKDGDKTGAIFCAECNSKRKGKHKKSCSQFVE